MGGILSPKLPAPPPIPVPPPAASPPTTADTRLMASSAGARNKAAVASIAGNTVGTSSQGDLSAPSTTKSTLLGG